MGDSCYRKCLKSQGQDSKQERHKISKTVVSGPVAQTASCSISSVLWIAPKIHKYLNYIQGFYPWRLFTHNPSSWPALSPQANCSNHDVFSVAKLSSYYLELNLQDFQSWYQIKESWICVLALFFCSTYKHYSRAIISHTWKIRMYKNICWKIVKIPKFQK